MVVGLMDPDYQTIRNQNPNLLACMIIFMMFVAILLLNLLIAQLTCAYQHIFEDMVGYARLHRASLIVKSVGTCPHKKWTAFIEHLRLDSKLEFETGDTGPSPGIQVYEASNACTSIDMLDKVQRYGGSTDPKKPWPEDSDLLNQSIDDRLETMEGSMKNVFRKLCKQGGGGGGKGRSDGSDLREGEDSQGSDGDIHEAASNASNDE